MSTDLSPRATAMERKPLEVRPVSIGRVYWIAMVCMTGLVTLLWFTRGPNHPVYALIVTGWTLGLGPGVGLPVMRHLPARWFRVSPREQALHRMLGVGIFGWLLDRSGWNRHVAEPMRRFDGTKAGLPSLELSARAGASAHGTCFTVHIVLAAVASLSGYSWGALWILLGGVLVHLYPALLQRAMMLRLQRLLEKFGA